MEENTKAALEPLGEEPAEEVKALAEKEVKLKEAAHKVELTKAALELFARRNIPVTGAPLKVFEVSGAFPFTVCLRSLTKGLPSSSSSWVVTGYAASIEARP